MSQGARSREQRVKYICEKQGAVPGGRCTPHHSARAERHGNCRETAPPSPTPHDVAAARSVCRTHAAHNKSNKGAGHSPSAVQLCTVWSRGGQQTPTVMMQDGGCVGLRGKQSGELPAGATPGFPIYINEERVLKFGV